jgi:transcriptional regulator with XRE-family HTH domain
MSAEKNPLALQFGKNLQACRERTGVAQESLGVIAGLHRTEVSMLERGLREPRLSTIVKLADALSIPLEKLLVGIEWKPAGSASGEFKLRGRGDVPAE